MTEASTQVNHADSTRHDCNARIAGHPQFVVASIWTRAFLPLPAEEHRLRLQQRDGLIYDMSITGRASP
jgi:hypothetical protein